TGLVLDSAEPPHVWHQEIVDESISPNVDGVINDYFLVRTDRFEPQGLWTPETLLNEGLEGFAWWTVEDIRTARRAQVFSPRNLATLLPTITPDAKITSPVMLTT
ncbi:MAG: NUDIX hydrolase, partial [Specibacter sp.]